MIEFIAGTLCGSVLALSAVFAARAYPSKRKSEQSDTGRLNGEQIERERWLQEQQRQHENMMNYTGREQR